MHISITYCNEWNYGPQAASLADEIKKQIGAESELIAGGGGIFDVKADGKLIYSKKKTGRFPEPHEVIDPLKTRA